MQSTIATSSATTSMLAVESAPAQGALDSAGAGIVGGYTGNSLNLKITLAFLLGLALYNAVELLVLILVTFQRFRGVYFWSLVISAFGVIFYALGFLIKFFRVLDPNQDVGYVAVVMLTFGWYAMVTGQSVVLWSRLHLVTASRRLTRWTLYMIIINGVLLHSTTTVLTFGSNSNSLSDTRLARFVHGYSIMEKIQMVGFFVQEFILSAVYIRETIRLLRLSESVQDEGRRLDDGTTEHGHLKNASVRKTMYQLLAINVLIIILDLSILSVEFANLYLIETSLKGAVYSIKLKLEFSVLGKLVQLVRVRSTSNNSVSQRLKHEQRGNSTGLTLEKTNSGKVSSVMPRGNATAPGNGSLWGVSNSTDTTHFPDFVDPSRISSDITHAKLMSPARAAGDDGWETRHDENREKWKRRTMSKRGSWIDQEMDKHNIG
ncbi:hypothetical protein P153DRAFT_280794 [Dothidotthia symphoricarpi CBS 119687]|uniref:DUF7703 domain-containing protein n=1 Tax=Dothidotthia symphoricarpi CBS 119687 TaxID=1392245 RepID=A0A6A6ASJ7_9PLEO|nr:uncharacterized protein P153DRAFT_280794 [Dothidotthia symphoricarpi CBS 119687]KAF2133924.1 hypothetical protein P153DRAFT_280794 [Dothidotthia symphoricarpi CBS 119687]